MLEFRTARPDDHGWMSRVVDDWWGRPIVGSLPRLFLDHFWSTSTVVEDDGRPVAFLVGFLSPSQPGKAYIHFVGVDPEHRSAGLGRDLYERFFMMARERGAIEVSAVTSPINTGSIAFHRAMGFDVSDPFDGYDQPGAALVHFHRTL